MAAGLAEGVVTVEVGSAGAAAMAEAGAGGRTLQAGIGARPTVLRTVPMG